MTKKNLYAELGLVGFFLIITGLYLLDTYKASARTENLLLILPASVVIICLALWILGRGVFEYKRKSPPADEAVPENQPKKKVSIPIAMAILAAFVLSMDWIGFDVATFLFMSAMMWLQGERRWYWLVPFPVAFAFFVSLFFEYMVPYPMPMLLGREFLERLL